MGGVALAIVSALLLILAFPPFHLLLLPFVALVPLGVALGSLKAGQQSGRTAAWLGLSFGVVHWGILLAWVPLVVAPAFSWAYPGFVVQVGLLSGLAALTAWGTHRLHAGCRVPLGLALPLAWVSMEWLKAHFPLGLSFPWLGLGISLTSWPRLLGIAEWTGEGGVAFWLATVNGLLAAAVVAGSRRVGGGNASRRPWGYVALAMVAALIPAVAGGIRARTLPLSPGPTVAVVGTNVARDLRLLPLESSAEGLAQARKALEGLSPGAAQLVVLPEATVAVPLDGPEGDGYREALGDLAREVGAPVLVGALGRVADLRGRSDEEGRLPSPEAGRGDTPSGPPSSGRPLEPLTNSAFLVEPDASLGGRYDKVHLVPGMEWGGFVAGRPGVVIPVSGHSYGPLVCYESLYGALALELRRSGAGILVNLSSDVWFGEGSSGFSSVFLHQHAAHLVMRAVETRVGVARAANGGFSFLLDPLGERVSVVVPPGGGLVVAAVPTFGGVTLFARTGDLLGPGALLASALLVGLSALRPRRHTA